MAAKASDEFTGRMFEAINGMRLDMLAAVARKDYDDRRRRQAQGQAKAKAAGLYKGRGRRRRAHRGHRADDRSQAILEQHTGRHGLQPCYHCEDCQADEARSLACSAPLESF
jgi:DNA invertase Pin-like site-specific DNA recombinase